MKDRTKGLLAILAALVVGAMLNQPNAQAQVGTVAAREIWTCSLDNIAATLTRCKDNPDNQRALMITDIIAQSTTTTGGTFLLEYGTGSNCGTGTTALLPSAASAARISAPASTAQASIIQLLTPLRVPPGKDLCVLGVATNTFTGQINGYLQ